MKVSETPRARLAEATALLERCLPLAPPGSELRSFIRDWLRGLSRAPAQPAAPAPCFGCGLDPRAEPSVRARADGKARCNSCESNRRGMSARPAAPTPGKYESAMRCASASTNVYEVRNSLGQVVEVTMDIEAAAREAVAGGPPTAEFLRTIDPPVEPEDMRIQCIEANRCATIHGIQRDEYRDKLKSAEAQLAAVREECTRWLATSGRFSQRHNCAEAILTLLAAPTGEGSKT